MKTFIIRDKESLARARTLINLDQVTLETELLKHRGLLPVALKYSVWATRLGGRILIVDSGLRDPASPPFEVPFNNVMQWVVKFCGRDVKIGELDRRKVELTRVSEILPAGWSAGIIFSGRDAEIPTLLNCLKGLVCQPELTVEHGGEIAVCGPERDLSFLRNYPEVRYIVHEVVPSSRFMICQKKNQLIRSLRGPRVAILHARIVLDEGCLGAVPREFDMISPNTSVLESGRRVPYLSLCQSESSIPGRMARSAARTMRTVRSGDPLDIHRFAPLFVDGGVFFVTKALHEACPLHDGIAWEEGEDVEWCMRAFAQGYLMDLAPDALALSANSKLRPLPRLGPLTAVAYAVYRAQRSLRAKFKHWRLERKGLR